MKVVTWNVERDRDPAKVLDGLETLTATKAPDALLLQETHDYPNALSGVAGYARAVSSRYGDGTAILVRKGLKAGNASTVEPPGSWHTVRGHTAHPSGISTAIVDGIRMVSPHTPPHVQRLAWHLVAPGRWRSYVSAMAALTTLLQGDGPALVGADWNVTADGDKGGANYPRSVLAGVGMTRAVPDKGTHGRRVIDYFGSRGLTVTDVQTLPDTYGSDHHPVLVEFTY